jgi:Fe-S cluster assembly iron-binding protein IscA
MAVLCRRSDCKMKSERRRFGPVAPIWNLAAAALASDDAPIFSTVATLVEALKRSTQREHKNAELKNEALRLGRELLRGTKYEGWQGRSLWSMLFRSRLFLGLGFDFPLQTFPLGLNYPSGAQTVKHHEVQLLARFCSSRVPRETDRTVSGSVLRVGARSVHQLKQEVSQHMFTVTDEAASVLKAVKKEKRAPRAGIRVHLDSKPMDSSDPLTQIGFDVSDGPNWGDAEFKQKGLRIFVEETLVEPLEDRTLDVEEADDGMKLVFR